MEQPLCFYGHSTIRWAWTLLDSKDQQDWPPQISSTCSVLSLPMLHSYWYQSVLYIDSIRIGQAPSLSRSWLVVLDFLGALQCWNLVDLFLNSSSWICSCSVLVWIVLHCSLSLWKPSFLRMTTQHSGWLSWKDELIYFRKVLLLVFPIIH